jgi:hypothetical protein
LDEVTGGVGTTNQTLLKLGEFNPGRATAGWDAMEFFPLLDSQGNLVTLTNWGGAKTIRLTILPGADQDQDYFMFIPVVSEPSGGPGFSSFRIVGANFVIAWEGPATLEAADNVAGPWTPVANATSPATIPISGARKFLRLR